MAPLVHSLTGLIHTVAAVVALITGTMVLLRPKGTRLHRRTGYIYVGSMLVLNGTAFGIYRLFGGFGLFHAFALLSLVALVGGMLPALQRPRRSGWYLQHLEVMSWSVLGLYAAFAAEVSVRFFPPELFFWIVGISGGLITMVGARWIRRRKALERTRRG